MCIFASERNNAGNGQNNGYFDSGVFNTFNGSYDDPTLSNSIPADLKYSVVLINVYH